MKIFYGILRFIMVLQQPATKPYLEPHQSIHTLMPYLTSALILFSHLYLGLCSLPSGFPTKVLHAFLNSVDATCCACPSIIWLPSETL